MYFTYLIQNELLKTYTGHTNDLQARLHRHNGLSKTKTTSYTAINKGEWFYVYVEGYNTREEARQREKQLKTSFGRRFVKEIKNIMGR